MPDLFHPDPVMYGLAVNGNIQETAITGMKDPGSNPEKVIPGNQDIGKMARKVINGIRAAGSDKCQNPGNRKAPL
jgi:hypothetical protein